MKIAILTPSRERPDRFCELEAAIRENADNVYGIEVYLGLDTDDPCLHDYRPSPRTFVYSQRRQPLAPWTNFLATEAMRRGADILGFLGDDHRPRTDGWDYFIQEAFRAHGKGLVYCDDGHQGEKLPTAPFWSAEIIQALGYYYPPQLKHLFADNFWLRLATDLDRCTYLPSVLIEHMHPDAGKAKRDRSYNESQQHWDADEAAYEALVNGPAYRAALSLTREAL